MADDRRSWTDERVENILGNLLRIGVVVSGLVVLAGGIFYLLKSNLRWPGYHIFQGEPADLRNIFGIIKETVVFRPRAIIQFGLLILIATPVARVLFSVFGFLRQKDRTYVAITSIVLVILDLSLAGVF